MQASENPPDSARAATLLESALNERLDAADRRRTDGKVEPRLLSHVLQGKLTPVLAPLQIQSAGGAMKSARRTGFQGVFKHVNDQDYSLVMANGQTVACSREEIEIHALIESYLHCQYGEERKAPGPLIEPSDLFDVGPMNRKRGLPPNRDGDGIRDTKSDGDSDSDSDSDSDCDSEPTTKAGASDACRLSEPTQQEITAKTDSATAHVLPTSATPGTQLEGPSRLNAQPALRAGQQNLLRFMDVHLDLNPLAFFDAIAREDVDASAYLAVQAAKMQTRTGAVIPGTIFMPSMYPGVVVQSPGHGGQINGYPVQREVTLRQREGNPAFGKCQLTRILREEMEGEMVRQNALIAASVQPSYKIEAALPLGIPAQNIGGDVPTDGDSTIDGRPGKQDAANMRMLLTRFADRCKDNPQNRVTALSELANDCPAAAACTNLVDQMLHRQGQGSADGYERYCYPKMGCSEELMMQDEGRGPDALGWGPTFLPGIERSIHVEGDAIGSWRIVQQGVARNDLSKEEIFQHVASGALEQLQRSRSVSRNECIYPQVIYELFADATGQQVPSYLKEHEAAIIARAAANKVHRAEIEERMIEGKRLRAEANASYQKRIAILNAGTGIRTPGDEIYINDNFDRDMVTSASEQYVILLDGMRHDPLSQLRHLRDTELARSHFRQAIGNRHIDESAPDRQSWLRASWAALLTSIPPDFPAQRYLQVCKNEIPFHTSRSANTVRVLDQVTKRFAQNPGAFLLGAADGIGLGANPQAVAYIERGKLADQDVQADSLREKRALTTHDFLERVQFEMASCFRYESGSIMGEVGKTMFGGMGSLELPLLLHSAFQVPFIAVEAGEPTYSLSGAPSIEGVQLHFSAPKGSEIDVLLKQAVSTNQTLDLESEALNKVLRQFSHLPWVWLEGGTYSLYLPKKISED